jgi:ABC-type transport system, involved in lipoprotein release, permease component
VRSILEILGNSFVIALQELLKNKLRTFLSLFGVTIGIFCIIGVLATVNSLKRNIQNEIKQMGSNIIFIDKWVWGGGPDYPWWKFANRPYPKYHELKQIKERSPSTQYAAFFYDVTDNLEFSGSLLNGVKVYGVTEEYNDIQKLTFDYGRYISDAEFHFGTNVAVIGHEVATKLFVDPELALNKQIKVKGKQVKVIGVIKKQGKQLTGGWEFDRCMIIPYHYAKTIYLERYSDPKIMVKGYEHITSTVLKDELEGVMRSIHKLRPTQESDFALNDLNDFSKDVEAAFAGLNIGGAIIGGISLIVGLFGVANIMFVTVKERTPQIGLKKALGAKNHIILTEFLLESAFLCVIGGLIGLILVAVLAIILSKALEFPVYVSVANMVWTFIICVLVGVVAGIIPAMQAAKMNPVVAIRS